MITRISDIIHEWLGWCPNYPAGACRPVNQPDKVIANSPGGGVFPASLSAWLQRFRNWILVQAMLYTAFVAVFLPLFATGAYLPYFIAGMVIASLAFLLSAHRLWRHYNDVLVKGRLEASETKKSLIPYLLVTSIFLMIGIETLIFLGYFAGIDFLILPAFMVGLAVIPWYVFLLVIVWEKRTGRRLYLGRKGEKASMFVVRVN